MLPWTLEDLEFTSLPIEGETHQTIHAVDSLPEDSFADAEYCKHMREHLRYMALRKLGEYLWAYNTNKVDYPVLAIGVKEWVVKGQGWRGELVEFHVMFKLIRPNEALPHMIQEIHYEPWPEPYKPLSVAWVDLIRRTWREFKRRLSYG